MLLLTTVTIKDALHTRFDGILADLECSIWNGEMLLWGGLSQGLLGLCCLIETRDRIERITLTAVLFD